MSTQTVRFPFATTVTATVSVVLALVLGLPLGATAATRLPQVTGFEKLDPMTRDQIDKIHLLAACDPDKVWFAGRCRGEAFFAALLPQGQKLVSVYGSRSKLAQTVAVVLVREKKNTLVEYVIDDEGKGMSLEPIKNPNLRNVLQQGAAQVTSSGLRYRVSASTVAGPEVFDRDLKPTQIDLQGGLAATLGDYKIVTRALYSQGYIDGRGFLYDERLENVGGLLRLYYSRLEWEPVGAHEDFIECTSPNYIREHLAGSGTPGCNELTAIADSGGASGTQTTQACGALAQEISSLAGWAVTFGCGAVAGGVVTGAANSWGAQAAIVVTVASGGQVELGAAADVVVMGAITVGGSALSGTACNVVGDLFQDAADRMQGCSQGMPLTDKDLQAIYQHVQNGLTILEQIAAAIGCPSSGVTEVLAGASDHCGGGQIQCTRHGQQHCEMGATGSCTCDAVVWDDGGAYECECQ